MTKSFPDLKGKKIKVSTSSGTFCGTLSYNNENDIGLESVEELINSPNGMEITTYKAAPNGQGCIEFAELKVYRRKAGDVVIFKDKINYYEILED